MKKVKKKGKGMKTRRVFALERLEFQLNRGSKVSKTNNDLIPLTDKDKNRIEREIEALKSRID